MSELRKKNRDFVDLLRTDSQADHGHFDRAVAIGDEPYLAEAHASEAIRLFLSGNLLASTRLNARTVELLAALPVSDQDPFFNWLVHNTAACLAEATGDDSEAQVQTREAEAVARRSGLGYLSTRSLLNLGHLAAKRSDPVKAFRYYLQVLNSSEAEERTRNYANTYLGNLFEITRNWEMALFYLALGLLNSVEGAADSDSAIRGRYAEMLARLGDYEGARTAIDRAAQTMVVDSVLEPRVLESRARVEFILGNIEGAMELVSRGIHLLAERGASTLNGRMIALKGEIYLALGQPTAALSICNELQLENLPSPLDQDMWSVKIEAHRLLGQFEEAVHAHDEWVRLSRDMRVKTLVLRQMNSRALVLVQLQDRNDSLTERSAELVDLQREVQQLMDRIANDMNGPLTTLQLVFHSIEHGSSSSGTVPQVAAGQAALKQLNSLVADIAGQSV